MVTNMMRIVTEAEMMGEMTMEEKENGAAGMMTDMVGMVIHMALMETGIVEITRSGMVKMATGMMTTVEEVKTVIIRMFYNPEALIGMGTILMKMIDKVLPGL